MHKIYKRPMKDRLQLLLPLATVSVFLGIYFAFTKWKSFTEFEIAIIIGYSIFVIIILLNWKSLVITDDRNIFERLFIKRTIPLEEIVEVKYNSTDKIIVVTNKKEIAVPGCFSSNEDLLNILKQRIKDENLTNNNQIKFPLIIDYWKRLILAMTIMGVIGFLGFFITLVLSDRDILISFIISIMLPIVLVLPCFILPYKYIFYHDKILIYKKIGGFKIVEKELIKDVRYGMNHIFLEYKSADSFFNKSISIPYLIVDIPTQLLFNFLRKEYLNK